jgi:two-component sensor histidine kinase
MNEFSSAPRSTVALRRIDRLTGRVFTIGALLTGSETVVHALEQSSLLNQLWLWLALSVFAAALIFNFVNFWFLKSNRLGYLIHGAAYLFAYATWWLQVGPTYPFDDSVTPWLWGAAGTASIAVGMFIPRVSSFAYMVFVPISWCLLHASAQGGSEDLQSLISDGLYVSLFPGTLAALVWMLRQASMRADRAADASLDTQIAQATREAQLREQTRVDSILYTSVFDTLKAAAKAKSSAEYSAVVQLSKESLERIEAAKAVQPEEVSTMSLFEALERIVAKLDPECELTIKGSSLTFLPKEVATALSDAAVQALNNSLQHAGAKAKRKIHLRSTRNGVKLVVSDDGIGFRPSKVPDQSLGFRFVIVKRVKSVGGDVHIDSAPSAGTKIILEWEG